MSNTASEPSAKGGSLRVCAVLLLLLIPMAIGALLVAKHGSHGIPGSCFNDEKGECAASVNGFQVFVYRIVSLPVWPPPTRGRWRAGSKALPWKQLVNELQLKKLK